MKKPLLIITFAFVLGSYFNRSSAQCSGAAITISPFSFNGTAWAFDWTFVQGNASLQLVYFCDLAEVGAEACIIDLKDYATANGNGPHHVSGIWPVSLICPVLNRHVKVRIWTNHDCGGNSCDVETPTNIPLPVAMTVFTARRDQGRVILDWQTASELNNTGFTVEKRVGDGEWTPVGTMASQGLNGNSDAKLDYRFTDNNNEKGISQYRIKQQDFDGRTAFSEVRAVRGEGQVGKVIAYPNPSFNGIVKLMFEDGNAIRDITVIDINGRVVTQLRGVATNTTEINSLLPGMYSIRIIDRETSEQILQKVLVNKR